MCSAKTCFAWGLGVPDDGWDWEFRTTIGTGRSQSLRGGSWDPDAGANYTVSRNYWGFIMRTVSFLVLLSSAWAQGLVVPEFPSKGGLQQAPDATVVYLPLPIGDPRMPPIPMYSTSAEIKARCATKFPESLADGSSTLTLYGDCAHPMFTGSTKALFNTAGKLVGVAMDAITTNAAHASHLAYASTAGACWMAYGPPPKQQGEDLIFTCDAPNQVVITGLAHPLGGGTGAAKVLLVVNIKGTL